MTDSSLQILSLARLILDRATITELDEIIRVATKTKIIRQKERIAQINKHAQECDPSIQEVYAGDADQPMQWSIMYKIGEPALAKWYVWRIDAPAPRLLSGDAIEEPIFSVEIHRKIVAFVRSLN